MKKEQRPIFDYVMTNEEYEKWAKNLFTNLDRIHSNHIFTHPDKFRCPVVACRWAQHMIKEWEKER